MRRTSYKAALKKSSTAAWLIVASLLFALPVVHAAEESADGSTDDPPSRVARLSYLKGEVSLRPAGSDDESKDWTEPTLNRPLTSGDTVWVGRGGRAELQLGSANIHLDQTTSFEFLELTDTMLQGSLTGGVLHLQVRRLEDGEVVEVDTPQAAVIVKRAGEYRIAVTNDGTITDIKNYDGDLEVIDSAGSHSVAARQQASFANDGERAASLQALGPRDEFDAWAQERNRRVERSVASRYVSPDVIGYEDLDEYGDWAPDTTYGHVWYPRHVAVDWSPYRHGHWSWISPWGWTWVDYAPWGFAPFHYGRWAHLRGRWCWVPGPSRVRAVYAPALVAWVGGAPGISVSISFGHGIGWFPLAPHEIYVPGYWSSRRYWHHVNHSNTVIVNNIYINRAYTNRGGHVNYANRRIRNAVTVVNRDTFVRARPVNNHLVRVNDRELRNWRSVNSAPAIVPERVSRLSPRGAVGTPRDFRPNLNRETIARRVNGTASPRRSSFEQEQRAIRDNDNRPVSSRQLRQREGEPRATTAAAEAAMRRAGPEIGRRSDNEPGRNLRRADRPQERATNPNPQAEVPAVSRARPDRTNESPSSPARRTHDEPTRAPRIEAPRARDLATRDSNRSAPEAAREAMREARSAPDAHTPAPRQPNNVEFGNNGRRERSESRPEPRSESRSESRARQNDAPRGVEFRTQRAPEQPRSEPVFRQQEAPRSAPPAAERRSGSESRGGERGHGRQRER